MQANVRNAFLRGEQCNKSSEMKKWSPHTIPQRVIALDSWKCISAACAINAETAFLPVGSRCWLFWGEPGGAKECDAIKLVAWDRVNEKEKNKNWCRALQEEKAPLALYTRLNETPAAAKQQARFYFICTEGGWLAGCEGNFVIPRIKWRGGISAK